MNATEKMTLEQIIKNNTNAAVPVSKIESALGMTRGEVINEIRKNKNCALRIGRKGRESMILTGTEKVKFEEARAKYSQYQKSNKPRIPRAVKSVGNELTLQLKIAGQLISINVPVEAQLVN